ncbi:MAG: cytochrome c peroxidase [Gemmataceae bacterium]
MTRYAAFLVVLSAGLGLAQPPQSQTPSPIAKDTLPTKLIRKEMPLGLKKADDPKDNPTTEEKVALGRKLFFDPILSGDKTVACATCHHPDNNFAGNEALPRGIHGTPTKRKAPTIVNRAFGTSFFWDGRATTLEEQALMPIEDPNEMGAKLPDVLKRLSDDAGYKSEFAAVFPDGVTKANLAKALAAFQRCLIRGESPVDKFMQRGERSALTQEQLHGVWLYESKGMCWKCHSGQNFTDDVARNTGVSWGKGDLGRYGITKKDGDQGRFKTPTLRGVGVSGPYMHDSSLKTLEDVVEFYNKGGTPNPYLDSAIKPLGLTKEEKKSLVEFLKAL